MEAESVLGLGGSVSHLVLRSLGGSTMDSWVTDLVRGKVLRMVLGIWATPVVCRSSLGLHSGYMLDLLVILEGL